MKTSATAVRLIAASLLFPLLFLATTPALTADSTLFGAAAHYNLYVPSLSIAAGDLTGEGDIDLVAGSSPFFATPGFGSAAGAFSFPTSYITGNTPGSIALGFFNDDAHLDVALACTGSNYVSVRMGDGTGYLDTANNYSTGVSPTCVAAGDLNDDGFDDLVVANRDSESVSVLLNDQDGTFSTTDYAIENPYNPDPNVPIAVALGDFDGDGDLDIVVLLNADSSFWPMWNDGSGQFVFDEYRFGVGISPVSLAVGDSDGDGFDDVAVISSYVDHEISVWTGYGEHGEDYFVRGFHGPDWYSAGDSLTGIATGDFDGDGKLDLAVTDYDTDTVSVLLGDGTGAFGTPDAYDVGDGPVAVVAGDFDSNGCSDLAVANSESMSSVDVLLSTSSAALTLYDWGDAPDPSYPTLLVSDGARHAIDPTLYLGASIDDEEDGQPNATATGDDNAGLPDDEDGVVFTSAYIPGENMTLEVTASDAGYLDAWVDFNNNGDWGNSGEQVFTSELLAAGVNGLSVSVPEEAVVEGSIFARFRFSSVGGLSYTGEAEDGEVEDYELSPQQRVELSLKAGWNMVSVPVVADDMSRDAVFPGVAAVYTWNPVTKSYSVPTTIEPEKGYWVAATVEDTITVTGTPVTEWTDGLSTGWNMIGSTCGDALATSCLTTETTPDPLQRTAIYSWNPDTKSYQGVSVITQGWGYWLASAADCTATLAPTGG